MKTAESPPPPWRRAERAIEDQDARAEEIKKANISENETPTQKNYAYNRENLPPGVMRPGISANSAVMKSFPNTLYDTCQDHPCLKHEGKETKGQQIMGVFPLSAKFDDKRTMIVTSFYLRAPGCFL